VVTHSSGNFAQALAWAAANVRSTPIKGCVLPPHAGVCRQNLDRPLARANTHSYNGFRRLKIRCSSQPSYPVLESHKTCAQLSRNVAHVVSAHCAWLPAWFASAQKPVCLGAAGTL
jgi:hypothetical protein